MSTNRRKKLDLYLSHYIKTSSKWIQDLSMRPEIMKLLDSENVGSALHDVDVGKDFLDGTPFAQKLRSTITK